MSKDHEFTAVSGPITAMLDWIDPDDEENEGAFGHTDDGRFYATQGDGGFWVQRCRGAE